MDCRRVAPTVRQTTSCGFSQSAFHLTVKARCFAQRVLIHTTPKTQKSTHEGCFLRLVEAAGIEPASENHLIQLSPSAVRLLRFPSRIAGGQAMRYGSHYAVTVGCHPHRSRSPRVDASLPVAVLRGKTGSLIRPPGQQYCCRLLFKIAAFIAGRRRYSLTVPHNPRRSLCDPILRAVGSRDIVPYF